MVEGLPRRAGGVSENFKIPEDTVVVNGNVRSRVRPGGPGRKGLLVAMTAWMLASASAAAPAGDKATELAAAYEKASGAKVGLSVVDLRTGEDLARQRQAESFTPASNQKVLTSAVALARLGGRFEFITDVYVLDGTAWVVGGGDPTLGDPWLAEKAGQSIYAELDRWSAAVRRQVGEKLPGGLTVVPSFGQGAVALESHRHPDWSPKQYHRWYMAPVAGLGFHNNCYDVTWTVAGASVTPHVAPASRWIRVANEARKGARQIWSLRGAADESVLTLRGTVARAARDPISVPASNPPILLARVLADRLEKAGVKIAGPVQVAAAAPPRLAERAGGAVCRTVTPLAVVMARANKRSQNTVAECLFLRAGDGTWAGSATLARQTLESSYGLPAGSVVCRDGSGLSHGNRVTPSAMTAVLRKIAARPDADVFVRSLSVAGVDGTLRGRMTAAATRGRVLGKTGYILGVSCLSGYVLDKAGKPAMAFAILVNGAKAAWQVKQFQDRLCALLVAAADR